MSESISTRPSENTLSEEKELKNVPFECPLSKTRSSATPHKCVKCDEDATYVIFDGEEQVRSEINNQDEIDAGRAKNPPAIVQPTSDINHVGYICRKKTPVCDEHKRKGVYKMYDGTTKEIDSVALEVKE